MKIGIDYSSALAQKTGIGRFACDLVAEFQKHGQRNEFFLYTPKRGADLNTPARMWWEAAELPAQALKDKVDILFSPGFACPPDTRLKKAVIVHDLIGLIYPGNTSSAARLYWQHWLPRHVKSADLLIASSESTRRDILRLLRVSEKKVRRVYLAARSEFKKSSDEAAIAAVLSKFQIKKPYFIAVSSLEPRKNHINLLRAYQGLDFKTKEEVSLVLVGKDAGTKAILQRFIRENALQSNVHLIGYVSDEELIHLYSGALAYAAVSLYEGFGLTALEAMRCGLAGVASNRSSLPEVTGKSAFLVDPLNVSEIREALKVLIRDSSMRSAMQRASLDEAAKFSMEKTSDNILGLLKELA